MKNRLLQDHLSDKHNITLLEPELEDIVSIVKRMLAKEKPDAVLLKELADANLIEHYNDTIRHINIVRNAHFGNGLKMDMEQFREFHKKMELLRRQISQMTGCYTSLRMDEINFDSTMLNLQTRNKKHVKP